jgi:hypothetical protein
MLLRDMIETVNGLIDDVADNTDLLIWLNAGKDEMAIEAEARFPSLTTSDMSNSYAFDDRFHMGPVYYAAAKYKEQDSSLDEAINFMQQFDNVKKNFALKATIDPQFKEDGNVQHFIASEGQTDFLITKNSYNPRYGDVQVYVNGKRTYAFTTMDNTITLPSLTTGDMVSCIWEEHADLVDPPYNWWKW